MITIQQLILNQGVYFWPQWGRYDAIEIDPVFDDGIDVWRVDCDDTDQTFSYWSIYLHADGEGVECLADFRTEDEATAAAYYCQKQLRKARIGQ